MVAYVGIGGNVGSVAEIVARFASALRAIAALPYVSEVRCSPLYKTPPQGPVRDQPAYINAVLEVTPTPSPLPAGGGMAERLLRDLQRIEAIHGRDRPRETPQGPRTLDLDLLLCGDEILATSELTVPHPRMHERAFVLVPLSALAPADLPIPNHGTLAECLRDADVQRQASDLVLLPAEHAAQVAPVHHDDQ